MQQHWGRGREEVNVMIKLCVDGHFGNLADEVIHVVSFQDTPLGMCPYLILAGIAHTINDCNDFWKRIIKL